MKPFSEHALSLDLELRPAPGGWHERANELLADPWLARKVERTRRIREHFRYLLRHVPGILDIPKGQVVDIGPGPGELLEIARALGHDHLGVDAVAGDGGMGDGYLEYCRLMHQRQGLSVTYCGFERWLAVDPLPEPGCVVVNLRGSIEQALHQHMDGPPHHLHHDCSKLAWRFGDDLAAVVDRMCLVFRWIVRDDGIVLIHCNGASGDTQDRFDRLIDDHAARNGFDIVPCDPRMHKWRPR